MGKNIFEERKIPAVSEIPALREGYEVCVNGQTLKIIHEQRLFVTSNKFDGINEKGETEQFCFEDIEEIWAETDEGKVLVAQKQKKIPYITYGELYKTMRDELKASALWTDILDYDLADSGIEQENITSDEFELVWSISDGSEGFYLDLEIEAQDRQKRRLATLKTLYESDAAYRKMAMLGAEFAIVFKKWMRENHFLCNREGYGLAIFNESKDGRMMFRCMASENCRGTELEAWADAEFEKWLNHMDTEVSASLFRMDQLVSVTHYPEKLRNKDMYSIL
jgi:hypothetical protein